MFTLGVFSFTRNHPGVAVHALLDGLLKPGAKFMRRYRFNLDSNTRIKPLLVADPLEPLKVAVLLVAAVRCKPARTNIISSYANTVEPNIQAFAAVTMHSLFNRVFDAETAWVPIACIDDVSGAAIMAVGFGSFTDKAF